MSEPEQPRAPRPGWTEHPEGELRPRHVAFTIVAVIGATLVGTVVGAVADRVIGRAGDARLSSSFGTSFAMAVVLFGVLRWGARLRTGRALALSGATLGAMLALKLLLRLTLGF